MRSDEFGTNIGTRALRIIDTVVATRGVPVSWGEGRNAKRLTETLSQQCKRYFSAASSLTPKASIAASASYIGPKVLGA